MKKIVFVAYDLNPSFGSEAGKANLWLELISKHYFVEAFTSDEHKKDIVKKEYENVNFNFVTLNSVKYRIFRKLKLYNLTNFIFIKKIKPLLKEKTDNEKYSLIHCITPAGIHAYNDLYKLGIPVIIGPLGGGLKVPRGFEKIFKKQRVKNFLRDCYYDFIMHHKKWQQYFINAKKIIIGTSYLMALLPKQCHNRMKIIFDTLVDPLKFKCVKNKQDKNVHICFSARMEPQKGCHLLIEAFISIAKENKNVILDFVGAGSSLSILKKIAADANIKDRVRFWGLVSRDQVLQILNQADIFCLPTLREPGGVAILEAMACELPVVTTNYGGPAYSVTEDCGIKIEPINYDQYVKDLEKALLYLIKNKNERIRMGKNGRKRVIAEFSPKAVEKKIIKVYNEVLKD